MSMFNGFLSACFCEKHQLCVIFFLMPFQEQISITDAYNTTLKLLSLHKKVHLINKSIHIFALLAIIFIRYNSIVFYKVIAWIWKIVTLQWSPMAKHEQSDNQTVGRLPKLFHLESV